MKLGICGKCKHSEVLLNVEKGVVHGGGRIVQINGNTTFEIINGIPVMAFSGDCVICHKNSPLTLSGNDGDFQCNGFEERGLIKGK